MARGNMRVTVSDKGPGLSSLLADLAGAEITVGIHDEDGSKKHPDSDLTVGRVMGMHELGVGGQKERSWLRKFLDSNEDRYVALARESLQRVLAGGSRKKEADALGDRVAEEMRRNILEGKIEPALSAATVASKGHSIPLLDSGAGVEAIKSRTKLKRFAAIRDPSVRGAARKR